MTPAVPAGTQIVGTVLNQFDQSPVSDAWVLVDSLGKPIQCDTSGKFKLQGLSIGLHNLHVYSNDNDSLSIAILLHAGTDTSVRIELQPLLNAGLVLYLPLHGTLATNASTWNPTTNGDLQWTRDRFGSANHAALFHGDSEAVIVAGNSLYSFDSNNSFSMLAWINTTTKQDGTGILSTLASGAPGCALLLANSKLQFLLSSKSGGILATTGTQGLANIVDGAWHFIALGVDRENGGFAYAIWLDSTILSSGTAPAGTIDLSNTTSNLTIGSNPLTDASFRGEIGDVRIYDRCLSNEEFLRVFHEKGWPN